MPTDTRIEAVLDKLTPAFRVKRLNEQLYGNSLAVAADPNAFKGAAWMLMGIERDVRRMEAGTRALEQELGPEPDASATEDERELYRQQQRRLTLQRDALAEQRRALGIWLQEVEELQAELAEMGAAAALKAPANGTEPVVD